MKKLFLIAATLFAAASFLSCSDNDDDNNLPFTPANLAGTWQIIHTEGCNFYSDGTWDNYYHDFPDASETFTFDTNGTCMRESHRDGNDSEFEFYNYSISGNTLSMICKTNSSLNFMVTILELTGSRLVIFRIEEKTFVKSEESVTYKRVK